MLYNAVATYMNLTLKISSAFINKTVKFKQFSDVAKFVWNSDPLHSGAPSAGTLWTFSTCPHYSYAAVLISKIGLRFAK